MWGPSRPVAPEAEQQPVTWLTLPQHSNTVAETISCTDSPSPRERNRKCFLFLSRNNGAHTQPSPVERRIRHHFFFVSKLDRVCILAFFFCISGMYPPLDRKVIESQSRASLRWSRRKQVVHSSLPQLKFRTLSRILGDQLIDDADHPGYWLPNDWSENDLNDSESDCFRFLRINETRLDCHECFLSVGLWWFWSVT